MTVLLEYLDLLQIGGRAQQAFGRAWALTGMPLATRDHCFKLMYLMFCMLQPF